MATIDRVGIEDILAGYDMYEACPYYALFAQDRGKVKDLKFVFKDGDREEGKKLLQDNLEVLKRTGFEPVYLLRFYEDVDSKGRITDTTAYSGSFTFRIKPAEYVPIERVGAMTHQSAGQPSEFLQFLLSERNELQRRVEDLEEKNEALEQIVRDYENEPEHTTEGGFMGAIKNPEVREAIKDGIYLLKSIFSNKPVDENTAQALAGLDGQGDPQDRINNAVGILLTYYISQANGNRDAGYANFASDMELLAKMTANPLDFNYAISKLRESFKK